MNGRHNSTHQFFVTVLCFCHVDQIGLSTLSFLKVAPQIINAAINCLKMPQGNRKLASKRPKGVVVKADKEKLRKQTPKMKKGGR